MDIQGPRGPQPPRPGDVNRVGGSGPREPGDAGFAAHVGGAAGAQGKDPLSETAYAALRQQILDSIRRGQDKGQFLQQYVDEQLTQKFGSHATPRLREAVLTRLREDPQLSRLFNSLYSRASRDAGG